MNSYLLNRSLGTISPVAFHIAQSTRLVHGLEPAPSIRFAGSHHHSAALNRIVSEPVEESLRDGDLEDVWAHKAGVNVLTIDEYEKR